MMLEYLDISMEKPLPLLHTVYQKINLKWIIKQSVRDETIEFLELQHIRQKSLRPWVRQTFLRQNSKNHKAVKEKNW